MLIVRMCIKLRINRNRKQTVLSSLALYVKIYYILNIIFVSDKTGDEI